MSKSGTNNVEATKTAQNSPAGHPADSDLLYGRDFTEEPLPISGLTGEMGEVAVRGKIISMDTEEMKNARTALIFDLSDFTDTITIKIVFRNNQFSEAAGKIKRGIFVKMKGTVISDKSGYVLTVGSITGIRKIPDFTTIRADQAPKKRVELHCHTKMSSMGGVSEAWDLIRRAYKWGHSAIAITDHGVVQSFPDADDTRKYLWREEERCHREQGLEPPERQGFFKVIYGCEVYLVDDLKKMVANGADIVKKLPTYHATILAANITGRKNLYTLISESHLTYYDKRPRVPKSLLLQYREGLIIGSACGAGELYRALLEEKSAAEVNRIAGFYDYLEIQPVANNLFLAASGKYSGIRSAADICGLNHRIVALGEELGKPVVATGDVHFLDPEDEICRHVIMDSMGCDDADGQSPLFLRTTEEMLAEFAYLGKDKAEEVVVANSNLVAGWIDAISPVRPDKCYPVLPDCDRTLTESCFERAYGQYGAPLPAKVQTRLEEELRCITGNGFATIYLIAQKLVRKSLADGYLVGSRGLVGASFVAAMAGITEVNPLSPHYYCTQCHYSDFDSEEVRAFAGRVGYDMPDRACPVCGRPLKKDGFDIPFEAFLGFKGDREPDIDLNFSGEYQHRALEYAGDILEGGQAFRAGTLWTLSEETAFEYAEQYYRKRGMKKRDCEIRRIASGCAGIRCSTGQHPGGIIFLPPGEDINSFTPVQHPANDMDTNIVATHFDYHSIDHNLLKQDILGHDDPTMLRMLQDLTGVDPASIPLPDEKVMSLFKGTEALGIRPEQIGGCRLGTMGVPEFGPDFVLRILEETKPESVFDLICISGLSHGTDTWEGNARELILEGKATLSTVISNREGIMNYLVGKGMDRALSFTIMESVRKGKGLKPEWEKAMREAGVPEWYLGSCNKIRYLFPTPHAAVYVTMAWRITYYKVYYPLAYYAAFFSIRAAAFSYDLMCRGQGHLENVMADYKQWIDGLSQEELDTYWAQWEQYDDDEPDFRKPPYPWRKLISYTDMRIVQEMYARGFEFVPIDIHTAHAWKCQVVDGKIMPPLCSIEGLGKKAATAIAEASKKGAYLSIADFRQRTKVPEAVVEQMEMLGLLRSRIIIVGVGKAGNNVVNRMIDENMTGVEFIGIGADEEALQQCKAPKRLLISGMPEGSDSGAKTNRQAEVASVEKIKASVSGADVVFVICGMGGSTGMEIAPLVAKAIKDLGIWTVGVVTKPFWFESNTRRVNAGRGIVRMQDCVDNLIVISNNTLKENVYWLSMPDALKQSDEVIWKRVQGITDLINLLPDNVVRMSFEDMQYILRGRGSIHVGVGTGNGEDKAYEAVEMAVKSLLPESPISNANLYILHLHFSGDITMDEADSIADYMRERTGEDANFLLTCSYCACKPDNLIVKIVFSG